MYKSKAEIFNDINTLILNIGKIDIFKIKLKNITFHKYFLLGQTSKYKTLQEDIKKEIDTYINVLDDWNKIRNDILNYLKYIDKDTITIGGIKEDNFKRRVDFNNKISTLIKNLSDLGIFINSYKKNDARTNIIMKIYDINFGFDDMTSLLKNIIKKYVSSKKLKDTLLQLTITHLNNSAFMLKMSVDQFEKLNSFQKAGRNKPKVVKPKVVKPRRTFTYPI